MGGPYSTWSDPITLNDDGLVRAQGMAALETLQWGANDELVVQVLWVDHRLTPTVPTMSPATPDTFPHSANMLYDIFTKRIDGGGGLSENRRITEESSIVDLSFAGDYNDITAVEDVVFGAWTDRRHQTSIFALEDNVVGARFD